MDVQPRDEALGPAAARVVLISGSPAAVCAAYRRAAAILDHEAACVAMMAVWGCGWGQWRRRPSLAPWGGRLP